MANIIIYPQGNTGNTDPHVVFDDGTNKLQFNVKQFLLPYWKGDVVFEELRIVGTRLSLDFYKGSL
jgi:hypothetical protein